MSFSMRCFLLGHDDSMVRAPERLWLRCEHCGRETSGWTLARGRSSHKLRSAPTSFAGARRVTSPDEIDHRRRLVANQEVAEPRHLYPYRWMKCATVTEASRPQPAAEPELTGVEAEEIRLAA
jgi:hypothetical protein